MSATVPTLEPSVIRAGDTLTWSRTLADYPASLWTLTYYLIGEDEEKRSFTATASVNDFLVTVAAAVTALWAEADYLMVGKVTKAAEQYQVFEGEISVLPNLSTETNYDGRSFARKMLEKVEEAMLSDGLRTNISYSINGRSFTARTHQDLLYLRDYLRAEISWEKSKGRNRKVITRFAGS